MVPAWELRLLEPWHTAQRYLVERRVPRKYEEFGLVKLDTSKDTAQAKTARE